METSVNIERTNGGGITIRLPDGEFWQSESPKDFRNVFRVPDPEIGSRYIYFLYCAGHVKIGISKSVVKRMGELQIGSPWRSKIVFIVPGGRARECFLHFCFSEHRVGGEWFRISPEMRAIIREFAIPDCVRWLEHEEDEYRDWIRQEAECLGLISEKETT